MAQRTQIGLGEAPDGISAPQEGQLLSLITGRDLLVLPQPDGSHVGQEALD